jgi:hypothetical protein
MVQMLLRIVGWALIALGAISAVDLARSDRKLRALRRAGARAYHYWIAPWRLQEDFYTDAGTPLVKRAWRRIAQMYGFTLLGALLVALAS